LVEQRGGVSGVARRLIDLARFFAFFDYRLDFAVTHLHGHAIHGAVMRQWEDIDGFYGVRQYVLILLNDGDSSHKAADFRLDLRVLQRDKAGRLAVFADDL